MTDVVLTQYQRDLLKKYRAEAFGYLTEIQAANENLKDVIEAAADGTGLEKKIISKFFKALFKQSIQDIADEAEILQFLAED